MPLHRGSPDHVSAAPSAEPRLVLGIATTGRPAILADTVRSLLRQDRKPDLLVLSVAEEGDFVTSSVEGLPFPVEIVMGPKGLTKQRNRILAMLEPNDLLLFLDDDFLMAEDYIAQNVALMVNNHVAMTTGTVLADGVIGRGLSLADGEAVLAKAPAHGGSGTTEVYNGYGCNMAVRAAPIIEHNLRFDEDLPAYGWLEDVDFSRVLAPYGQIIKAESLRGVHLGTKAARTPGLRLGYSQIVNPVYLMRKGTMIPRRALKLMARNVLSNIVYSIRPRPWTDSRGRLRGNLKAMWEVLTGKAHPQSDQ